MSQEESQQLSRNVEHPQHYTRWKELAGIEVIDITRHLDNDLGNVCKYVMRAGFKENNSKLQDLLKAKWYLEDEIYKVMGFKPEEPEEESFYHNKEFVEHILEGKSEEAKEATKRVMAMKPPYNYSQTDEFWGIKTDLHSVELFDYPHHSTMGIISITTPTESMETLYRKIFQLLSLYEKKGEIK